jgi:hypothetical protein
MVIGIIERRQAVETRLAFQSKGTERLLLSWAPLEVQEARIR